MDKELNVGQSVELIRLKVKPENVKAFVDGRVKVDGFTSTLKGYVGTEILQINESEFLMLIRWESNEAVLEAQKLTYNAPIISEWLNATAEFISFETTDVMYEN